MKHYANTIRSPDQSWPRVLPQHTDSEEDQMKAIQHCEECLTFASPFHLTEKMQTAILCKRRNANNVLTLVFITDQQDSHGTEQMLEGCGSC